VKTFISSVLLLNLFYCISAFGNDSRTLTIRLKGVAGAKISLVPFNGFSFATPIYTGEMKHGEQVSFPVDATFLPGEFVLRFNYQLKDADTPRPAELPLILNKQDITVSVNPEHIVPDSVTFENDRENITWKEFSIGNVQKRNQLGLLQQLLNIPINRLHFGNLPYRKILP